MDNEEHGSGPMVPAPPADQEPLAAEPLKLFTPDQSALTQDGVLYLQAFSKEGRIAMDRFSRQAGMDNHALKTFSAIFDACDVLTSGGSPNDIPPEILKHFGSIELLLGKARELAIRSLQAGMEKAILSCGAMEYIPTPTGTYTRALQIGIGEDGAKSGKKPEDRRRGVKAENTEGKLLDKHRYLIGIGDDATAANLVISTEGKKRITVYVKAQIEKESPFADLVSSGRIVPFQYLVYCIICGIYDYQTGMGIDKPIFWPEMVYSLLPGAKQSPAKQDLLSIDSAISVFRDLKFTVDLTNDYKLDAYRGFFGPSMTGNVLANLPLLSLDDILVKLKNGSAVHGYRLNDMPLLYRLDSVKGQVGTVRESDFLELPCDMTKTRKLLLFVLLSRIDAVRYSWKKFKEIRRYEERRKPENKGKPLSLLPVPAFTELPRTYKFIKWDTLFFEAGIDTKNRMTQKRNRDFCLGMLDIMKSRGRIKDYKAEDMGGKGPKAKATGILIILED